MSAQLDVFLPLPLTKRGPSYTCGMLSREMNCPELNVTIVAPRASFPVGTATVVQTLPYFAKYVPYRWVKALAMEGFDEKFLSEIRRRHAPIRAAYIWPDAKLRTIRELQKDGIVVFREMINCHRGTAKAILDDAYARIGAGSCHAITEISARGEQELLDAVDHIFCPNRMVEDSLIEHGISRTKVVPASYGWEPSRFAGTHEFLEPSDGITMLFTGSICVRKGCHLLLDYWAESNVRGRLVLAGEMEPTIREKFGHLIARDDVVVLDYVSDVGALYRSADVFVFPSLEEGGPQVTYEACGCGLPVITTPMGMGRIVRHGREGYVIDPYDRQGWITAIQSLAHDKELRFAMGAAATLRAGQFCWDAVARRRKDQILRRISGDEDFNGPGVSEDETALWAPEHDLINS